MPIGFYLVASNKPVCLTCIQMTLRNTQMHMLVPVTFSRAASKQLKVPWRFTLSKFQLLCIKDITFFFKCHLFGWISPGLKLRLADFICFPACSVIAYSFLIMKYLICCRGWGGIVSGNPSVCQKADYSSIQHIYIIFIQIWSRIVRFAVIFCNHIASLCSGLQISLWE